MDSDAFTFPGASHVTAVNVQGNDIAALPEQLLWNMTSLLQFKAMTMFNLRSIPERFFMFQSRLEEITFTESKNLGRGEPLPDGLFKGLTSLATLYLDECGYQTLPNMDDLTKLTTFRTNDGEFRMNDSESESKFDGLESVELMLFDNNHLTRVPSLKNMGALITLCMASNKIATIFPGDFAGATSLVVLTLNGNHITSVDSKAFSNLAVFRVLPDQFDPRTTDGKPFKDVVTGVGLWPHAGLGYFGGGQEWANVPISFAPNPVQCLWVGPLFSDFDCRHCNLGYEAVSEDDATCRKPAFRPHRRWGASEERALLRLQDTQGDVVKRDTDSGRLTLLTGQTYTIPAPKLLENFEKMFVGYEQPYTTIKYELDFSLVHDSAFLAGADVEFGCGTSAVGNSANDAVVTKRDHAHPHNMYAVSFQWSVNPSFVYPLFQNGANRLI